MSREVSPSIYDDASTMSLFVDDRKEVRRKRPKATKWRQTKKAKIVGKRGEVLPSKFSISYLTCLSLVLLALSKHAV
jgi:hypothetical protein